MNIFSKIFTALKAGASEMGEAVVDANAITIFEQDIGDAKAALDSAKENEMSLMASKRQAQANVKLIDTKTEAYENRARAAMDKGEEALALETAGHIVQLQKDKDGMQINVTSLQLSCDKIKVQIAKAQAQIQDMENQLSQIKATESVHKAQESIHASLHAGRSSVVSAKESLARMKEKQAFADAKIEVAEELEDETNLDKKLEAAGFKNQEAAAEEILNKLKAKT